MTDSALLHLLRRGSLRLRWQRALCVGLAALGAAFVGLALIVLALRWFGSDAAAAKWMLVPVGCAALAALWTGFFARADLPMVAALLDARARTQELVTTWLSLRECPSADELRECFKRAQAAATLNAAVSLRVGDLLPWSLPVWHRAIWLALIVLLSALLMPARRVDERSEAALAERARANRQSPNLAASTGEPAPNRESEPVRMQVLMPAELRKLQLMATDTELPAALKAQALNELLKAIGDVPESALTQDVQQILELLRKDTRTQAAEAKNAGNTTTGGDAAHGTPRPAQGAAQFDPSTASEQARTAVAARFPDVQAELARYYETFGK